MLQIKTKVFTPQVRDTLVQRPRLISTICAGAQHALTLLSAPPGFGKTTVLAEWAASQSMPVAWLSLDEADNDPARFLAYLLFTLEYNHIIEGENPDLLQSVEALPPRITLEKLIRNLENVPTPFAVVLDDYHLITAQPVHDCSTFLLDHLPQQMHLVIATRADPPIPFARLRVRVELVELRADDLRFTAEETASFLERLVGVTFSPEEISLLEQRTEGWIAGLQLAALSMHGRKDIHSFIKSFSGSHRFILDYLVEEVINRQPKSIQQFLLQTSILERLTGSLCDCLLTGKEAEGKPTENPFPSSQSTLEYLEKSNLFLIPLDDERRWYRYHHLFAELLQAQLKQQTPTLVPELHRQASIWLEQNGYLVEAVGHLLTAGDDERAAEMIEQHGQERWSFSDLTFLKLISQLPLEMLKIHPKLGFYYAWMLITQGQLGAAESLLHQIEEHLPAGQDDPEVQGIHGFIQLLFTYIATLTGKTERIVLPSPKVLEIIPEHFLAMRNSADVVYAMLLSFRGEFDPAGEILLNTVRRDLQAQGTTATPISIALLARLRTFQGRLHEAAELCRKYMQEVTVRGIWRFYLAGDLNIVLGDVLREWNDLDEAEEMIRDGMRTNEPWQVAQGTAVGYIAQARLQQARGDLEGALSTLGEAEQLIGGSTLTPDLASELRTLRFSFELPRGDLTNVQRWAEQLPITEIGDYRRELDFIVLARFYIKQRKYTEALSILEQLNRQAEVGGRVLRLVKIGLLQAQAFVGLGNGSAALKKLETCLALAEPEGFVRTFLDEGEPVRELLSKYLISASSPHRDYAKRLLAIFPSPQARGPISHQEGLAEPLTEREHEVLRLICAGKSNQEIAAELVITLNTVKRHNNSIFSKLGVTNRSQAIICAHQKKLI